MEKILYFWEESYRTYGSPRIWDDLRDSGETCGENRVARLMREAGIQGSSPRKRYNPDSGLASIVAENHLNREFNCTIPNKAWVTDITYIKTLKGFAYLAVVVDLFLGMLLDGPSKII